MQHNPVVIKLSGKSLNASSELGALFESCIGSRAVIVHGGGVEVDALFKSLSLEVVKKNGLRVSPREHMPYICAALAGMCNKRLQSIAIQSGLKAIGILASDGGTLKTRPADPELGMVGQVEPSDRSYLELMLDNGYTPIIASLAHDSEGNLYNVNADDVAVAVAALLKAPLYFISDVPGVLDQSGKLIPSLNEQLVNKLIEDGTITGGMVVKVKGALSATRQIQRKVYIASYKDPDLKEIVKTEKALGTVFEI